MELVEIGVQHLENLVSHYKAAPYTRPSILWPSTMTEWTIPRGTIVFMT